MNTFEIYQIEDINNIIHRYEQSLFTNEAYNKVVEEFTFEVELYNEFKQMGETLLGSIVIDMIENAHDRDNNWFYELYPEMRPVPPNPDHNLVVAQLRAEIEFNNACENSLSLIESILEGEQVFLKRVKMLAHLECEIEIYEEYGGDSLLSSIIENQYLDWPSS